MVRRRLLRRILGGVAVAAVTLEIVAGVLAVGLAATDRPVHPPIGSEGHGEGTFPVVLIAGLESDGHTFGPLIAALEAEGVPVVDFDPARPGAQPLTWRPLSSSQTVGGLAATVIQPAIDAAEARMGLDPASQRIDVVAHSLGGLAARYLVERPGGPVEPTWAARVDDLVMVATPNHGTRFGAWFAQLGPTSPWEALADDMRPGSAFLDGLGATEPPGEVYTAIGGETWALGFLRYDLDHDGRSHGFDGVVPAESPAIVGAPLTIEPDSHGRLLLDRRVIDRITATLRLPAA